MRSLIMIVSCFCVATVCSEVCGLALLWSRGDLTAHTLREMTSVLNGDETEDSKQREDKAAPQASLEEVINARARMSAEYNAKESELAVLKGMMMEGMTRLTSQQEEFERRKKAFDKELELLEKQVVAQSTEQARGVLLALPPKDAVEKLMQLSVDQNVVLLKGMPEKSIAKILKEFKNGEKETERGKKIFEALNQGAAIRELLEREKSTLGKDEGGRTKAEG